ALLAARCFGGRPTVQSGSKTGGGVRSTAAREGPCSALRPRLDQVATPMTTTLAALPLRRPQTVTRVNVAEPAFVWCVWLLSFLAALWYYGLFCFTTPFRDDWAYVLVVVGEEPLTSRWFLSNGDHYIPLTKWLYYVLLNATG